jgi:hypothetical protein
MYGKEGRGRGASKSELKKARDVVQDFGKR